MLTQLDKLDDLLLTVAIRWTYTLQHASKRKHILELDEKSIDQVSEIRCDELYQSLQEVKLRWRSLQVYVHVNLLETGVIVTVSLLERGADVALRLLLAALPQHFTDVGEAFFIGQLERCLLEKVDAGAITAFCSE